MNKNYVQEKRDAKSCEKKCHEKKREKKTLLSFLSFLLLRGGELFLTISFTQEYLSFHAVELLFLLLFSTLSFHHELCRVTVPLL